MDQRQRLARRIEAAERALATLNELELSPKATAIERDAAIKRFEYSYDTIWTAARQFLLAAHGIDERSPKGVCRASRTMALLADDAAVAAINMTNDRNLTVHTYTTRNWRWRVRATSHIHRHFRNLA